MSTIGSYTTDLHHQDMHTMGINDLIFSTPEEIITCSSDRTVKTWKVVDNASLEEQKTHQLLQSDRDEYKDNVEK
jgi:WD40 repeat protein